MDIMEEVVSVDAVSGKHLQVIASDLFLIPLPYIWTELEPITKKLVLIFKTNFKKYMGLCPFIKHIGQFLYESAEIYPSIYIWGSKSLITKLKQKFL